MSQEFIAMLDYMEKERGIKRELLLDAVQTALLASGSRSILCGGEERKPVLLGQGAGSAITPVRVNRWALRA